MRFTKEQMLDELRTIFLFEADHILLGHGLEMAQAFIGFEPGERGEYFDMDPSRVDLGRFDITPAFEAAYEFAFRPSLINQLLGDTVQDLIVFMVGTPQTGGIASGTMGHRFMTPEGYCQTTVDAAFARWKLEGRDEGGGGRFTVRELALLANMSEGAVRNALSDKSEGGLRAIPGEKPVLVDYDEAARWLRQRRGFIPSPTRARDDRFLADRIRNTVDAAELGRLIRSLAEEVEGRTAGLAMALGWFEEERLASWFDGTFAFDEADAVALARALDIDPALFAGKAYEVSLRRSLAAMPGGQAA